jgi:hypothetical protein
MHGKWLSIVVLVAAACVLSALSSCGRSQELVSVQIQPTSETIGASNIPLSQDANAQVQLRALGTYIHPPVTKDITNLVTWASNDVQMFSVNSTGMLTATGEACGGALVSATVTTNSSTGGLSSSGAVVTGFMTANVVCFTSTGGGGASTEILTLAFAGSGSGTVTSSPPGLICSSACLGQFANGTPVTLTAAGTGLSQFGSWFGCDTLSSTNPCQVTLTANRTVTVTFN